MDLALTKLIEELNAQIRRGEGTAVGDRLKKLNRTKLPRIALVEIASIARKINQPWVAIKLLSPIVRSDEPGETKPSMREKVEYAASLIRVGGTEEALEILGPLESKEMPEILFFRSLGLMTQWNYAKTIPLLNDFLRSSSIDFYQRIMGSVNLLAALLYERKFDETVNILEWLVNNTQESKFTLARGYTLELAAQRSIHLRQWEEARKFLTESEKILAATPGVENLYVKKWHAVLELTKDGPTRHALRIIQDVREEAMKRGQWETLRDLDRWEGVSKDDEGLFFRVYFGTPFQNYRTRLLTDFPRVIALPRDYWLEQGKPGARPISCDLVEAEIKRGSQLIPFKAGNVVHRLLQVLFSDFYRPFLVTSLHHSLYPKQYFNPFTSPGRVHRSIARLRIWLKEHRISMEVIERDGYFRILTQGNARVRVSIPTGDPNEIHPSVRKLRAAFALENFSAKQASQRLQLGHRTTIRLLQKARENGVIEVVQKGAATRYRFSD